MILMILMFLIIMIDAEPWRIDMRGSSVVNSKANNGRCQIPSKLLQKAFLAYCVFKLFVKSQDILFTMLLQNCIT